MAKPPRKHHFVQAEHIRQFVDDDGVVHVYSKEGKYFPEKPEGIFKKKDLNSFEGPEGLNTEFEGIVTDVENECWPILRKIINSNNVEPEQIPALASYLSLSRLRNPTVQAGILELHKQSVETTTRLMDMRGHFDDMPENPLWPEKTISQMLDEKLIEVKIDNSRYLEAVMEMHGRFMQLLQDGFDWCIVRSERGRVLISDHPLTFVHPREHPGAYGIAPGGKGCEMAFPLTKHQYLLGFFEAQPINFSSEDAVDELNKRQAIFASRHIASSQKNRRWRSLAANFKNFNFRTVADTLPTGEGAYQFIRSGVYQGEGPPLFKGSHPLTKTKPLTRFLP